MSRFPRVEEFVWERTGSPPAAADPLDYRLSKGPVEVPTALREEIRRAMEVFPVVSRVGIERAKLLKSEELLHENVNVTVECGGPAGGLETQTSVL